MSDLSIVVVSFETRELTLSCLERIESELGEPEKTGGLAFDVTLVDNGSSDGTAEAVRSRFPDVAVIALPRNVGFAAGNNAALSGVSGRLIGLVNTDVVVNRSAVLRCVSVLDDEPDAGVAGPQLVHPDGRLQNSVHAFPSGITELLPTWLLELVWPRRFPSKRYRHSGPVEVDAVLGAALFAKRRALEATGPFSESYFFFLEETDLCWRMREEGFRVLWVPDARMVHGSGASSKRRDAAATRIEYHRSLYFFLAHRRGRRTRDAVRVFRVLRALPQLAWLLVAAGFSERARQRLGERWALLRWHLEGCPEHGGLRDP